MSLCQSGIPLFSLCAGRTTRTAKKLRTESFCRSSQSLDSWGQFVYSRLVTIIILEIGRWRRQRWGSGGGVHGPCSHGIITTAYLLDLHVPARLYKDIIGIVIV